MYTNAINSSSPRVLGSRTFFSSSQIHCAAPEASWGQSRLFSNTLCGHFGTRLQNVVAGSVAPNVNRFSTSVEKGVGVDKNFERIYVQGGLNVKPLVDNIDLEENVGVGDVGNDTKPANVKSVKAEREESEMEKEAWRILRNSVVTYCGSPVGTVAANDPNDKLPLNYDQVFIRDFIPSAFAFLLKGEGEIVRNFLLHTLQLQVICFLYTWFICTYIYALFLHFRGMF